MAKFQPGGPARFEHQKRGLLRLIETKGICALLFDAGTGKTATTMDYLSLLTLKGTKVVDGAVETRVLVVSPKAAVDTWVLQAQTYMSPQINVWAEVLGGSIQQKAETLISRGPLPFKPKAVRRAKDRKALEHRALNADRAEMIFTRGKLPLGVDKVRGPGDIQGKPRLVLLSTNLETFSSRARVGSGTMADLLMSAVKRFQPDVIVIDELHKIKGHGSNMSRLIGRIGTLTPRRIGLTGTVMPLGPMDVYAQWRFIQPTAFGEYDPQRDEYRNATQQGFQRRYGVMGGFMGREVVKYVNLDDMQRIMAQNSMVVRKEDALDLPAMTDTVVPVTLSPGEQRAYDEMKKDLAVGFGKTDAVAGNKLTQLLRLRQITAGFLPDDNGKIHDLGSSQNDTIASLVHDTLEGEKRVVIFALYRHEIESLRKKIERKGTEVMVITGDTSDHRRLEMRRRFGSAAPERLVLIAQVQTISLSVNELVTASHAIFATLSQKRDDLSQARDRLNRIGQTKPCTFWYVQARGTVDEVVYNSHKNRTDLEAAILRHVRGITEEEPPGEPVSVLD